MFTKRPEKDVAAMELAKVSAPPLPPAISGGQGAQRASARAPVSGGSMIGPDLVIIGNLLSRGHVQVDGEVQGDLHATNVVIGENARVTGSLVAEEVIVRGTVHGSIRGRVVALQSTSRVEGDVYHQSLSIEQGAFFEGKSRRAEDPLADVQRPDIGATNSMHTSMQPA